ncbi:conjugative transposon protein TraK [Flavobacterium daejeonense]|uniref:conjugative transposon protein TraK n=1 Tax=Flavobacterium daejeonense TaxID=350893 RepID=UPI00047B9494|nr:conjugative transposon protein TraK [Flavobacterium daejeonense]
MGLIKNIEDKIKLATIISISSLLFSLAVIIIGAIFANNLIIESRKSIYVLDKDVPILAKQTNQEVNRPVEYKAHVDLFHSLYFSLSPDEQHIKYNMEKAMYLIDESGMVQYNTLKEKGYFNQILASSAVLSLETDSIHLDYPKRHFIYYGKQKIERKSTIIIRSLITEGSLKDIPRSANNPHGVIIQNWKTIENKDLKVDEKQQL